MGQEWAGTGGLVDPADRLDDLGVRILGIELANPGASSAEIKRVGRLSVNRKTVDTRRRSPVYRRALSEARRGAIEVIRDAEVKAIHVLEAMLEDTDPRIRLGAAKTLGAGAIEYRRESLLRDMIREEMKRPAKRIVVEYVTDPNIFVIGEPRPAPLADLAAVPASNQRPLLPSPPSNDPSNAMLSERGRTEPLDFFEPNASSTQSEPVEDEGGGILGGILDD